MKQGTKIYQGTREYELHAIKIAKGVIDYVTFYDEKIGGRFRTNAPGLYTFRPAGKSSIKVIEPEDDHKGMIQGYDGKWRWL